MSAGLSPNAGHDFAALEAALSSAMEWWEASGVPLGDVQRLTTRARRSAKSMGTAASPSSPVIKRPATALAPAAAAEDALLLAARRIAAAPDVGTLQALLQDFRAHPLAKSARMVFADGAPDAPIMVVGEAPGAEEDRLGKPFVGPSGELLDKMLAAVGISRARNAYITNVVHWRPPGNRNPEPVEIAFGREIIRRHIELIAPKCLILCGKVAVAGVLGLSDSIARLRSESLTHAINPQTSLPCFAIFHPSYLLRRPQDKALMWADLLRMEAQLTAEGILHAQSVA